MKKRRQRKARSIVLSEHIYPKNGARISILFNRDGVKRKVDVIGLRFLYDSGRTGETWMRPDEAIMLIKLLSEGVFKAVNAYQIGLQKVH